MRQPRPATIAAPPLERRMMGMPCLSHSARSISCDDARRAASDDHVLRRFPDAEEFAWAAAILGEVEERFIERDVFGGRGECEFEALHDAVVP